jgi:hypothetical protein
MVSDDVGFVRAFAQTLGSSWSSTTSLVRKVSRVFKEYAAVVIAIGADVGVRARPV